MGYSAEQKQDDLLWVSIVFSVVCIVAGFPCLFTVVAPDGLTIYSSNPVTAKLTGHLRVNVFQD